jgi:hypothetical protein
MLMTLNSISFSAPDFSQNISNLKTTIDIVSTWMSANLLSLNQSKTEFLLIGLPKQLPKISDPTLLMPSNVTITPTDAARNLGVIFDSSLTMSDHISSVSKSCFPPFEIFAESEILLTILLLKLSLRLLFIPKLTIATLSF